MKNSVKKKMTEWSFYCCNCFLHNAQNKVKKDRKCINAVCKKIIYTEYDMILCHCLFAYRTCKWPPENPQPSFSQ